MLQKIKSITLPHLIGMALLGGGWFLTVLSVGIDRFTPKLFTTGTIVGLAMILLGAYLPETWAAIRSMRSK
ncbi:MAG: hypothetical protein KDK41_02640 [Leptospiraceae bacterium]|nr:hypothetical protein [Leptospiraceae bacterium]